MASNVAVDKLHLTSPVIDKTPWTDFNPEWDGDIESILRRCEADSNHYVYAIACDRQEEYADMTLDDVWGHPEFSCVPKQRGRKPIPITDQLSKQDVREFIRRAPHLPGKPEETAIPMWFYLSIAADTVYYVGESPSIYTRYQDHIAGETDSNLHQVFQSSELVALYRCDTPTPIEGEYSLAFELTNIEPSCGSGLSWNEVKSFAYRGVSAPTRSETTGRKKQTA